ncbi:hypothetical protein CAOG_00680 [Capsaspora owczarzaki ATCC 30864]|uniref:Uncharacterized protein n=1 Tax=Capsaspora owczarzaki (strain ATCC 30864) TaxID=595528 RepID=A0A0D2WHP0_CAPO3|nr:hypothetical protein CAOG_00680 [Capsaspora owczarzaki ATCC 30864]KJE89150.1 hypothetical protein CAOG_000680 [Capsaspora owczarzaki ATCC 30864]|eukprot:XP_004365551.2 hypothetical protein CAOG_00680 [Capsaspora owczarzaki ATCC 30864]
MVRRASPSSLAPQPRAATTSSSMLSLATLVATLVAALLVVAAVVPSPAAADDPALENFLTELIVDAINHTNITSVAVNMTNLVLDEPGIVIDADLDAVGIYIDIDSQILRFPIEGASNYSFFTCDLNGEVLTIDPVLTSPLMSLNAHILRESNVSFDVALNSHTTSIDVVMDLDKLAISGAMHTKVMALTVGVDMQTTSLALTIQSFSFIDPASWIVFLLVWCAQWGMMFFHGYQRYRAHRMASVLANVPCHEMSLRMSHCTSCNAVSPPAAKFCGGCGRAVSGSV